MEKLPPTSYIRMVDIWLIFGQLIPFIEVALLTIMELFNETETINHHGHPRPVDKDTAQENGSPPKTRIFLGEKTNFTNKQKIAWAKITGKF